MSALLITHNLTYRIDDRTLWEGLNLTFSPGDMVCPNWRKRMWQNHFVECPRSFGRAKFRNNYL